MANALVIVESPAKAKTISGYLGAGYVVESSIGHIRDLPSRAAEVPKAYKSEPWARLGIDVDNGFKPLYVVSSDKRQQVRKLKSLLADADELYLATDEDREGEAIAWHLMEVLNPRVPVKRMVFHEITRSAISAAVASPRELDRRLVDAQEARRMLDRLYGYEVSPVLWKKVMPQLSAGRVQSVAVRIVVERERERMRFVSASFWGADRHVLAPSQRGARVHGRPRGARRLACRDRTRLRSRRPAGPPRRDRARRGRSRIAGCRSAGRGLRREVAHLQAVPAPPGSAVHHLHAAAGGGPQARHVLGRGDAGGPVAVREGLHHLHAHRQHIAVVGRGVCSPLRGGEALRAACASPQAEGVCQQGEERPGGPRGHPARGRGLLRPEDGGQRCVAARGPAVRAGVEADAGQPDDRLHRRDGAAARRRAHRGGPRRRVHRQRHGDNPSGLPGGVHRGHRRRRGERDRRRAAAAPAWRGRRGELPGDRGLRARDAAPGPLHRGVAGAAPRAARRGPPLHLLVDLGHDHRPGLRVEEGLGAGAVVHRVLGGEPAGASLPQARRLRLHR